MQRKSALFTDLVTLSPGRELVHADQIRRKGIRFCRQGMENAHKETIGVIRKDRKIEDSRTLPSVAPGQVLKIILQILTGAP